MRTRDNAAATRRRVIFGGCGGRWCAWSRHERSDTWCQARGAGLRRLARCSGDAARRPPPFDCEPYHCQDRKGWCRRPSVTRLAALPWDSTQSSAHPHLGIADRRWFHVSRKHL